MKVLRSPVFIVCLLLFMVHQILAKGFHLSIPIVDDYLDPLLAMPVMLTLWLAERQWLFKRGSSYRLSLLHVGVATAYVALVSEVLFPLLSSAFTADWVDVGCYAVGSGVFWSTINRPAQERRKKAIPLPKLVKNLKESVMKFIGAILFSFCFVATSYAQDKRPKIKDFLNQEIQIVNGFAGESMTLVKEGRRYFILRKIFGSGVPVIRVYKYYVAFNSDYQIAFSDTNVPYRENFILQVDAQGLGLYLNGLKVVRNTESSQQR